MKQTRTFSHTSFGRTTESEAYTENGGQTWRWACNDQFCPLDACKDYDIPCDPSAQREAIEMQAQDFIEWVRSRSYDDEFEAERRAEARAAHGEGVELVNVITGETWTT